MNAVSQIICKKDDMSLRATMNRLEPEIVALRYRIQDFVQCVKTINVNPNTNYFLYKGLSNMYIFCKYVNVFCKYANAEIYCLC